MPSWLSCLSSQPTFLGPAHAFRGQVKPTQIFRGLCNRTGLWSSVQVLRSPRAPLCLFCREARTSFLGCRSLTDTGEVPAGPCCQDLAACGWPQPSPGPTSHLRGNSLRGLQLCIPGQTRLHWSYFPNLSSETCWKRSL